MPMYPKNHGKERALDLTELAESMRDWRQHLHRNPEFGFEEVDHEEAWLSLQSSKILTKMEMTKYLLQSIWYSRK